MGIFKKDDKKLQDDVQDDIQDIPDTASLPPYQEAAQGQTLLVDFKDWKWKTIEITDPVSQTVRYTADCHLRKPNLIFKVAGSDEELATTIYHSFKSRIDVQLRGQALELNHNKCFSLTYNYPSPAFQGQTLMWKLKYTWKGFDYICLDEKQNPIARFKTTSWSRVTKVGQIELLAHAANDLTALEEILVTGVSMVYYTVLAQLSAASAGTTAAITSASSAAAAS